MATISKFLIVGPSWYNNYYQMANYLDNYIEPGSIIYTCGNKKGMDVLVSKYAEYRNMHLEEYPLTERTEENMARRNAQLVSYSQFQILFDDGSKNSTVRRFDTLCKGMHSTSLNITVREIAEKIPYYVKFIDNLGYENELQDACNEFGYLTQDFEIHISDFIEMLIADKELRHYMYMLDWKKDFEKSDTPRYDGIVYWLLSSTSVYSFYKYDMNPEIDEDPDIVARVHADKLYTEWLKKDYSRGIYSHDKLQIATKYRRVVRVHTKVYLEMWDSDIVRKNICKKPIDDSDVYEDDIVNTYYYTKDNTDVELFLRNQEFSGYDLKMGKWYVNAEDVEQI